MDALGAILERYRTSGLYTHAFAAHGRLDEDLPLQTASVLPDHREIFDLASLTKALVTVPILFHLSSSLGLDLSSTVGTWLGQASRRKRGGDDLNLPARIENIPIESLLRHESGLPAWWNFWIGRLGILSRSDIDDRIGQVRHLETVLNRAAEKLNDAKPQLYSDVGFLVLGAVLEHISGQRIPDLFQQISLTEMGFDGIKSRFQYATRLDGITDDSIPTSMCLLRGRQLVGEVHDENCASLGGETAHAGLFGSGPALVTYLKALYRSDLGRKVLESNARARVIPPGEPPNQPCLGWRQAADPSSVGFGGGKAMGHMGFTGVAFWVYPEAREYAILLTNRVISGRINPAIAAMRREVFTLMGKATAALT